VTVGILFFGSAVLVLNAAACQSRRSEPDPMSCAASGDSTTPHLKAEQLAGVYRLKLVATQGSKVGHSTEGTLQLRPYDSSLRSVTIGGIRDTAASYVLYGSAGLDLDAVDAVRPGDLESTDPQQPGALVIERKGGITIRLGSEANRRGVVRYDGGYTALRVAEVGPDRFDGTWLSGLGSRRSSGYFCAVREDGKDGNEGKDGKEAGS
jgi:hypothetical protein